MKSTREMVHDCREPPSAHARNNLRSIPCAQSGPVNVKVLETCEMPVDGLPETVEDLELRRGGKSRPPLRVNLLTPAAERSGANPLRRRGRGVGVESVRPSDSGHSNAARFVSPRQLCRAIVREPD